MREMPLANAHRHAYLLQDKINQSESSMHTSDSSSQSSPSFQLLLPDSANGNHSEKRLKLIDDEHETPLQSLQTLTVQFSDEPARFASTVENLLHSEAVGLQDPDVIDNVNERKPVKMAEQAMVCHRELCSSADSESGIISTLERECKKMDNNEVNSLEALIIEQVRLKCAQIIVVFFKI